jgi:hypothetical protein
MKTQKTFWGAGSLVVAGLLCPALAASAAAQTAQPTLEENMAAAKKQYVVPGRQLHVTDMKNSYRFCEIGLVTGTTKENTVLNVWNTTGVSDCPQDEFAGIAADKGDKIKLATGAQAVWINPPRYWTFNEFWVFECGADREFEGVNAVWMGVVGMEDVKKSTGAGHYNPGQIYRNNTFKFDQGSTVYLLDMPDGKVLVMQSWTNYVNQGETKDNLKDLGGQFKTLPAGWKFRVKVLDKDLTVTPPPPHHLAWVTQDEFQNTYQGCGFDEACNYVP